MLLFLIVVLFRKDIEYLFICEKITAEFFFLKLDLVY